MNFYFSKDFKSGLKVIFEKQPCCIESVEFVKPGKTQVFSRVRLRKLTSGQLIEKTFRPTDSVLQANVIEKKYIYMYHDSQFWYFMNQDNYEQIYLDKIIVGKKDIWLVPQYSYFITLWDNRPINILIDRFITLKVTSMVSNSNTKYTMSSNKLKLCKVETGHIIQVPLFIQVHDVIKINTQSGKYHERVNK